LIRRGDEAASANPLLTATNRHIFLHNEHAATIRLTINQGHAAFLIRNRKRFLVFVISVKASLVKVLAHARRVASGALAIIAVFMSHRHRHEPADGWLLPKASTQSLAGCISR
jgi:hypothetical protein